jgi:hypothetical protein
MFKKPQKAIITVENAGEIKQASGPVTGEPLPVQLTTPVQVERLAIVRTGRSIVITAGNDQQIINVEIKG